jgi:pimeloyl-ACP methyl ester carboxylesterase
LHDEAGSAQTARMPQTQANGITIEYDTFGDPADEALLLVMGFTAQLTGWEEGFCKALADRGRYVIRYDNRDVGLSTHFDGVAVDMTAVLGAMSGGPAPEVPYTLSDMAADGIGLLDALGIDKAHVMGASMGGMIVQTMAIEHPDRLKTVTSVMSTTGEPEVGQATPEAIGALLTPPPTERDAVLDRAAAVWKIFASPRYFDEQKARTQAGAAFDRAFYPEGATRQMAAIVASGSRADGLREVRLPMLVIHGMADTLIAPSGGRRTAELVAGANLLEVHDMGHDLPEPLWPFVIDVIISHQQHAIA